tara:strand:+ start:1 stop:894 length:894 start_codon:yes stop_codon:yes gene_type:complete
MKDFDCKGDVTCEIENAQLKLRNSSLLKGSVYPWRNNDFKYVNYVKNKYDPVMAKLSTGTKISDTFNNINLMVDDLAPALITDAMPNSKSKASVSGSNSDLINCSGKNNTPACKTMQEIQKSYLKQAVPYKNFEKDIKQAGFPSLSKAINGRNSSSYFLKVGSCPLPKLKSRVDCFAADTKYNWTGSVIKGECSKPKFAYVNNTPGYMGLDGMIPTLGKDILELSPDKFISVLMGGSVDGFKVIPCTENFKNKTNDLSQKEQSSKPKKLYHVCNFSKLSLLIILFGMMLIINKLFSI